MAIKTPCQTPDTFFYTKIDDTSDFTKINLEIILPHKLNLDKNQAELLEKNIHNALELVLIPYFKK